MTINPMGIHTVKVGGHEYRLWLSISVLAQVQAKMPEAFDQWMAGRPPQLQLVICILAGTLERWHPEQAADRYFIDEMFAENPTVFIDVTGAAAPSAEGKAPKAAKAASRPAR
jgi:hypothetical protein